MEDFGNFKKKVNSLIDMFSLKTRQKVHFFPTFHSRVKSSSLASSNNEFPATTNFFTQFFLNSF